MRGAVALLVLTGCSFDPASAPTDQPPPAGDVDAPTAGDAAELGEWSEPVPVAGINSPQNDDDPSLTADLLEIYFASMRTPTSPDEDIYVARRATTADPFGVPELVPDINTQFLESNVDVTADGLALIFTSDRAGDADLFIVTRPARNAPWGPARALDEINTVDAEYGGVLSADRLRLVLCSNRGGTDEALYAATRGSESEPFGAPQKLAELDTTADECDAMTPDGSQTIYFTRSMGPGNLDLFVAGPTFAASMPVGALNTTKRDGDPWVSPDQRTMVFASNRAGSSDDIYISTR